LVNPLIFDFYACVVYLIEAQLQDHWLQVWTNYSTMYYLK
jgi:hypothetical protein